MPKLQRIKRANGSLVYSMNIPLEVIEELDWKKGEELDLEVQKVRVGKNILVFKKEEEEKEENSDETNF